MLSPADIAEEASECHLLLSLAVISQPGLARCQTYYPLISFQISKTLQVCEQWHLHCTAAVCTLGSTRQVCNCCVQAAAGSDFMATAQDLFGTAAVKTDMRYSFFNIGIFNVHQSAVLQCAGNCLVRDLQISLSETLVWRAAEMVQRLDLPSLTAPEDEEHTEAATDVPMQMSLVSISNLAGKVRYAASEFSNSNSLCKMQAVKSVSNFSLPMVERFRCQYISCSCCVIKLAPSCQAETIVDLNERCACAASVVTWQPGPGGRAGRCHGPWTWQL